jgi:hypothetical protein
VLLTRKMSLGKLECLLQSDMFDDFEPGQSPLYLQLVQPSSAFLDGFTCTQTRPGLVHICFYEVSKSRGDKCSKSLLDAPSA